MQRKELKGLESSALISPLLFSELVPKDKGTLLLTLYPFSNRQTNSTTFIIIVGMAGPHLSKG